MSGGYAVAGALALALLVAVGCVALLRWRAVPTLGHVDRPLPVLEPSGANAGRFVVTVELLRRTPMVVYRGDSGARARDQFTANACAIDRRVTLTDGAAVRGFSDYGATR